MLGCSILATLSSRNMISSWYTEVSLEVLARHPLCSQSGQWSLFHAHPHPVRKVSSPSQGLLTSLELAPLILLPQRSIYRLNFQPTNPNQGPYRSTSGNKKKKKKSVFIFWSQILSLPDDSSTGLFPCSLHPNSQSRPVNLALPASLRTWPLNGGSRAWVPRGPVQGRSQGQELLGARGPAFQCSVL